MPAPELEVDNVELEEEVLEEELQDETEDADTLEESTTTTTTTKKKVKRKTFDDANKYVYKDADQAKAARKTQKYTDGTDVPDMRVWEVCKGGTVDEDTGKRSGHDTVAFIVQKTAGQAATCFLESQKVCIDLAFRKTSRGRGKSKIEGMMLMYGKLLQVNCMEPGTFDYKDGADNKVVEQWKAGFAKGGINAHYIDWETNKWKEATD